MTQEAKSQQGAFCSLIKKTLGIPCWRLAIQSDRVDWNVVHMGIDVAGKKKKVSLAYEQFCNVISKFYFFQGECNFSKSRHYVIVFYCTSLRIQHSAGHRANAQDILLVDSFRLLALLIALKDFPGFFSKTHPPWELHLLPIFPYHSSNLSVSF